MVGLGIAAPALADQQTVLTVNDVTVTEGNTGTSSAVFTVSLAQPSAVRTTVTYNTQDGSARAPGDYTATSGQLVFAPGTTSKTVAVDVIGDQRYEGDELFYLNIGSPGAIVPDSLGAATILDDDARAYLSVGDTVVQEGNSGTVNAVFPVTLDHASGEPVRVRYATGGGNAQANVDYAATSGTLTFAPGQTSASVTVPVYGDVVDERPSEYFGLTLSDPHGAQLHYDNTGIATIMDDDGTPSISVLDSAVVEGNSGTTNMVFKITLSGAGARQVVAYYGAGNGTATAPADYTPTYGTLIFKPGQTSKTVSVPIVGDTIDEGDYETMYLSLNNVSGATVADPSAQGVIVDDDGPPPTGPTSFLSVDTATVVEGDSGTTNDVFTVLLQPAAAAAVTVHYATENFSAIGGVDYTTTSGTLTIPAGATSATVAVPVIGDRVLEGDENFGFDLSSPSVNATISDSQGIGVIVNDDQTPTVSASDATVLEGDTGTTADAAFEVTLSAPIAVTASVSYQTQSYSAVAPDDFTSTSGTVTFQPGETTKVVHVTVNGDTIQEGDEQFYLNLYGATNTAIADSQAWAAIIDDDHAPRVNVGDTSTFEGTTSPSQETVPVTLDAPSVNTVTVNYTTQNGSAAAPDDYTATSGTVTFAPGQTTASITVPVQSDSVDEGVEYFYVFLNSPTNASLLDYYSQVYILDDDSAPGIAVDDPSVVEPDSGSTAVTFHATLTAPSLNPVTVNYATQNGSAGAPGDYTTTSGTLTFNPGETAKTITVQVAGDTIAEPSESFYLNLYAPTNAYLFDSYNLATIFDNDPLPNLSIRRLGITEGNSGTKNASLVVDLSPASPNTVTVNYTTQDGSATATNDYTPVSGTLTYNPGDTSKTITIPIIGDTVPENQESFYVQLSSPTNAGVSFPYGTVTIFDNDSAGGLGSVLNVGDTAAVEPDTGTTNETFTVTLTPASASQVTVEYSTYNGSAVADADYTPQYGMLTFPAGQTSATVTVPVLGDTLDEGPENLGLSLFALTGPAQYGTTAANAFIIDNDRSPIIGIRDSVVDEGNNGTVDAAFTVSLSAPSPQPVTVDWETRDGTAVAPGDYRDDGGSLTFAPGDLTKTVHVTVNSDNLIEGDEYFWVDLSDVSGAYIGYSSRTGEGIILDSDSYAVLGSVTDATGAPVAGTTLTLSGNGRPSLTATSAADGSFLLDNVVDGRYTLTPTAAARTFTPASYTVDVRGSSVAGLTFLSLSKPSVSGQILDSAGNPVPGVTVTRSGNSQPDATALTNGMGYYGFSGSPAGTYTIKPRRTGFTFTPATRSVTLTANSAATANFTASAS